MFAEGCQFVANNDTYYEHKITGKNQSSKIGTWVRSTHELMHIIKDEKILSFKDALLFVLAHW